MSVKQRMAIRESKSRTKGVKVNSDYDGYINLAAAIISMQREDCIGYLKDYIKRGRNYHSIMSVEKWFGCEWFDTLSLGTISQADMVANCRKQALEYFVEKYVKFAKRYKREPNQLNFLEMVRAENYLVYGYFDDIAKSIRYSTGLEIINEVRGKLFS